MEDHQVSYLTSSRAQNLNFKEKIKLSLLWTARGLEGKSLLNPRYRINCIYFTSAGYKRWLYFHRVPFSKSLSSRIYYLNQIKSKQFHRSVTKWSPRRKKMPEMVKMALRHFSLISPSGSISSESLSLQMLAAITFVLFILPQRLGDESTEKSSRMKKLKLKLCDTPGQFVLQSERHSLSLLLWLQLKKKKQNHKKTVIQHQSHL